MPLGNFAYASERREDRDEVYYRTSAATGAGEVSVIVVNISPNGLMARCDAPVESGTALTFRLPGVAPVLAEVRWALGGRIGCEFAASIPPARYLATLFALNR